MYQKKGKQENGNGNGKHESKGIRPWIVAYLALGAAGKIRTEEKNGKTFYQDQILAVWKKVGKYGAMLRGTLGLDRDSAMRVSLQPMYGIFEQIVEEIDGEKTYRNGRELLGTVQVLKKDDKEFPVVRLFSEAEGGNGLIEVLSAVGFVNGDVPESHEDSEAPSGDTGKQQEKAPQRRVAFRSSKAVA